MQSPASRPNALQIWIDAAATPDTQAASEGPFQCCYLGRQARGQSSFPCAGEPPHDCGDIIGDQPPQAGLFRCVPAYKSSTKVLHNRSIGAVELHFPRKLFGVSSTISPMKRVAFAYPVFLFLDINVIAARALPSRFFPRHQRRSPRGSARNALCSRW